MSYKKIKKTVKNFNIEEICNSGQCFRMEAMENGRYRVLAKDRCLEIEQKGEVCTFFCEEADFETFWKPYFDLERDCLLYTSNPFALYLELKGWGDFTSGSFIFPDKPSKSRRIFSEYTLFQSPGATFFVESYYEKRRKEIMEYYGLWERTSKECPKRIDG